MGIHIPQNNPPWGYDMVSVRNRDLPKSREKS